MVEMGLDTSTNGKAGGQGEGGQGREHCGAREEIAFMNSVQLQLGTAMVDLGAWRFVTVCMELMYVKPCVQATDSV